ncbi:cytochrome P450 monooxygenase [Fusarium flagelliforme]|uniref:cytochrome P450 monooxygenase n=1 Tax=Fusarium flagelliforme TaxID=2675880 RepID=UPI001E8E250A|nr:cytochrome P450 monooxygenase [Fusarium flagelliforme]KAH7174897.1 cytochrome P450 monooxygenase [Fusarium flagelliforme]
MLNLINDMPKSAYPLCFLLVVLALAIRRLLAPKPSAPLLNPRRFYELSDNGPVTRILNTTRKTIEDWFAKNPETPMRLICDLGEITVLPPSMADEIKKDSRLSFIKASNDSAFHISIPGFEPYREGGKHEAALVKNVVHGHLKKTLNRITLPLAQETYLAIDEYLGSSQEWHKIPLNATMLPLITRISTRVLLGEDLCRNEEWIRIASSYSVTSTTVAGRLRRWPQHLRYIVSLLSPQCWELRKQVSDSHALIDPILEKRRSEEKGTVYNDSLEWFEKTAKAAYDPADTQLFLTAVSIHTTVDLLSQALEDICAHPEIIGPLQDEIRSVIKEEGWNTKALYKMKLLDSALKETQRLKPVQIASMMREALVDVTLQDGTFIPKGHQLAVSCHNMRDEKIYPNADEWDGYRFYRERQEADAAREDKIQLSSTSVEHMGFGYGEHACPGRFFAAKEVKIVMMYLLLNYEWRIPEGTKPNPVSCCTIWVTDPTFEIEVRKKPSEDPALALAY